MKRILTTVTCALSLMACGDEMSTQDQNPDPMINPDPTPTGPQPRGATQRPLLGAQIDRTGRPAVSTGLIGTFNGDDVAAGAAKDAYNAAAPSAWSSFKGEMMGSMAILDSLDEVCGNQLLADDANADGRYSALANVLVDDQLYVSSASGTCGTYLGLEGEIVGALAAGQGGCGGRTPNDDIIERTYSVLALGSLTGFDDTIIADSANHTLDRFPFLASPR